MAVDWQGNAPEIAWAVPSVKSLKSLGPIGGLVQAEDIYNVNYDCTPETYRFELEPFGSMHDGCFAPTAFGQMDIANNVVQGFGFSGAIPVKSFGNQTIVPIPRAASIATLSGASPMGSYLHLYTYFPSAIQVQYDILLRPWLQLPQQSNMILSDSSGTPMIINAQSIAFSSNGGWMVVESPWHSFLRVNTATLDMLPFAPSFSPVLDYTMHSSHVAITDDGRYAAIQSGEFNTFKVYDLAACSSNSGDALKPLDCKSYDYQQYVSSNISSLGLIKRVRFVNDGMLSFHATHGNATDSYLLAPTDKIASYIDYLALGDSYTSGEGAFNYLVGTDTTTNMCHQSANSYPYLLARDVFTSAGGHSVACSGAIIWDLSNKDRSYPGQVSDGILRERRINADQILAEYMPGYLAQHEFTSKYQPRISTVSVGGNDIGFGDIIALCAAPHRSDNTCYDTYEDRKELAGVIDRTYSKWVSLYHQLKGEAPNTRYYAIGYPHIAMPHGNCGVNVHLNEEEVEFSEYLIDYLNSVIERAATAAGVTYIDIGHALDGHRLCEATSASIAVNGLTAGTDKFHVLGKESYHPNALGQELIEQAILGHTHNFADTTSPIGTTLPAPQVSDDNPLVKATKTGRPIRTKVPESSVSSKRVAKGTDAPVKVSGLAHNLKPNSTFKVGLNKSVIGSITSNEEGDVNGSVLVPANADSGIQELELTGPNLAGQEVDITNVVYVSSNEADTDEDGIPNTEDSCADVPNGGQDADRDGIDDACDSFIGIAPVGNNNPVSETSSEANSVTNSSVSTDISTDTPSTKSANSPLVVSPIRQSSLTTSVATRRFAGSVLGTSTSVAVSNNKVLNSGTKSAAHIARESLRVVYWQPWAVDGMLVLLLFMLLTMLFRRLSGE